MSKQTWSTIIGRTVLVTPADARGAGPFEYVVRAVSPSGHNVKLENRGGRTFWCKADEYVIDEILPDATTNNE